MYYIIIYKNTFDAMEGDRRLTEMGIEFKTMPTPTTIAQSCGICSKIDNKEDIERVKKNSEFEYKYIFYKDKDKFIQID